MQAQIHMAAVVLMSSRFGDFQPTQASLLEVREQLLVRVFVFIVENHVSSRRALNAWQISGQLQRSCQLAAFHTKQDRSSVHVTH